MCETMKNKKKTILLLILFIFIIGTIFVAASETSSAKVLAKTKINKKTIKITDTDCQRIAEGKTVQKTAGYKKYPVKVKKYDKKTKQYKNVKKIKKTKVRVTISREGEDGTLAPYNCLFVTPWTPIHGQLSGKIVYINYGEYYGFDYG